MKSNILKKRFFPNALTILNMFLGFLSIIFIIKGKYFDEWSREWKVHLERSQFAICQSEDTFNDQDVSEFFMTKQNTKTKQLPGRMI